MISVRQAAQEFEIARRADGLKNATLKWYRVRLSQFLALAGDRDLGEIDTTLLRAYIVSQRERITRYGQPSSIDYLRGQMKALATFFRWAATEYNLTVNPMARIRIPARPRQLPKAIGLDDLKRLFEACDDEQEGRRNKAILAFLCDTGCRAGGLLTLKLEHIDLAEGRAVVVEKFDKARAVRFTDYTAYLIQRWLDTRPDGAPTLFCSVGTRNYGEPLKPGGLRWIMLRLKERAGVKGRVNPHSFRHGFAREYLRNGGDLATLSRLLGHSSPAITIENYAVYADKELAAAHRKFSPIWSVLDGSARPGQSDLETEDEVSRSGYRTATAD